jgi:GTP-binding protein LepA
MDRQLIRNFSIIAHIDHGKSTLADRILELTGAVNKREFREQFLDAMELERERGITIKAKAVRLNYKAADGRNYCFNLIDTPGHVDFTYEVAKSLAACEGAVLVVDAAQGVEAQTVANLYLAMEHNLRIVPVINKIDLSNAQPQRVKKQIVDALRLREEDIILASAKEGKGILEVLEGIIRLIPPPGGDPASPLQALIFDSTFNIFKGVIVYVRLINGRINRGMKIKMMDSGKVYEIHELGIFRPYPEIKEELQAGEVGYLTCNIKDPKEVNIGETITELGRPAQTPLAGYRKVKPLVYCGIYPVNPADFPALREAVEKLKLNDASFVFEPESSPSIGAGFRCGFLGLLHMEIVQERLEREYNLNLILTTPNVVYRIQLKDGRDIEIDSPAKFPSPEKIAQIQEPYIRAFIIVPVESMSSVIELSKVRRGQFQTSEFLGQDRMRVVFLMPLSEAIVDFYDKIKSITRGYGSLDYEFYGYLPAGLVKLEIMINGQVLEALSTLVHKDKAYEKARAIVAKLKELIPRQLFEINIQAAIGKKVIAKEKVSPLGKHVTGKCYGGDITRKRKLWEKQKAGKKRMKQFGKVQIPQEAFMAALKI